MLPLQQAYEGTAPTYIHTIDPKKSEIYVCFKLLGHVPTMLSDNDGI